MINKINNVEHKIKWPFSWCKYQCSTVSTKRVKSPWHCPFKIKTMFSARYIKGAYLLAEYLFPLFEETPLAGNLLPRVPKFKNKKFQISVCKIKKNKCYHVKVLLKRFHFNSHTMGFHPQTQKLELHYIKKYNARIKNRHRLHKILLIFFFNVRCPDLSCFLSFPTIIGTVNLQVLSSTYIH